MTTFASPAYVIVDLQGNIQPGREVTLWTDPVAGNQVVGIKAWDGQSFGSVVPADQYAALRFADPGDRDELWVQEPDKDYRWPIQSRESISNALSAKAAAFAAQATASNALSVAQQKTADVSVKSYGATGDGITDDRNAIQTAFDAAVPGQRLLFPAGVYMISTEALYIPDGIHVVGYGAVLRRGVLTTSILVNWVAGDQTTGGYDGHSNITIEGLTFDSDGDASGRAAANLTTWNHARNLTFRNCVFQRTKGTHSLELNSIDNALVDGCRFEGFIPDPSLGTGYEYKEAVQLDVAKTGSNSSGLEDGTMARNVTVRNCWFGPDGRGNGAPAVGVGSHARWESDVYENIVVSGCVAEGCSYALVDANYWGRSTISGNVIRSAPLYGIRIVNDATNIVVSGNMIDGPSTCTCISMITGVGPAGVTGNLVTGNRCVGGSLGDTAAPAGNSYTGNLFTAA